MEAIIRTNGDLELSECRYKMHYPAHACSANLKASQTKSRNLDRTNNLGCSMHKVYHERPKRKHNQTHAGLACGETEHT